MIVVVDHSQKFPKCLAPGRWWTGLVAGIFLIVKATRFKQHVEFEAFEEYWYRTCSGVGIWPNRGFSSGDWGHWGLDFQEFRFTRNWGFDEQHLGFKKSIIWELFIPSIYGMVYFCFNMFLTTLLNFRELITKTTALRIKDVGILAIQMWWFHHQTEDQIGLVQWVSSVTRGDLS